MCLERKARNNSLHTYTANIKGFIFAFFGLDSLGLGLSEGGRGHYNNHMRTSAVVYFCLLILFKFFFVS
jgi:hypothetical protein